MHYLSGRAAALPDLRPSRDTRAIPYASSAGRLDSEWSVDRCAPSGNAYKGSDYPFGDSPPIKNQRRV